MASITQQIQEEMERVYGKLGSAQESTLAKIISDEPAAKDYHISELWCSVNKQLASPHYKPEPSSDTNENLMENLFKCGDDYPDIYSSDPDDIDMGNFL